VGGPQLAQLMFPQFDATAERAVVVRGMAASPGAAVGRAVFDSATAVQWAQRGESVVLVRKETNPDDLSGMIAAAGILTSRGGKTSHAAVVARGMGKTAVCSADALVVDALGRRACADGTDIVEGDLLSVDGSTGEVFLGALPVVPSPVVRYLEDGLEAAVAAADEDAGELVRAVDRLLQHADGVRTMAVRANADTAEDAERARKMGAEGHRSVPDRAHVPRRPAGPGRTGRSRRVCAGAGGGPGGARASRSAPT
jgi:pyruvate,orthophosphate dikinase